MIPPRGIATRLQKRLAHEVREGKEHGPPLRGRELEVPRFQGCLVTVRGERTGAGLAATANRPCPSLKVLVNSGVGEVGLPKSPEEQADVYIDNTSNKEDVHPIKQTFDGRLHFGPQKIAKEQAARMVVEPKVCLRLQQCGFTLQRCSAESHDDCVYRPGGVGNELAEITFCVKASPRATQHR